MNEIQENANKLCEIEARNDIDRGFISKCGEIIFESKDHNKETMKYKLQFRIKKEACTCQTK